MPIAVFRPLWRDWGFAESLSKQASHFLDLARQNAEGDPQKACVRAAILFSLMSFEAYWSELVRGYIQKYEATADPEGLRRVKEGLESHTGIREAVKDWPKYLTGQPLDTTTKTYADFVNFTKYRNWLLHGKITEQIPSWRKLAQDVETIEYAELAQETLRGMVRVVACHFGSAIPMWV